ncbi:ImmA/IrrE family metallo-endopeptidase [Candidatus Palauibacter sp.]|uniref:ImmA/IrrE family metallo-endopeptidase n=1 Tax=Candidatus Palauibacter sp. TaxID=3101350 RepID=UPI003D0E441A
MYQRGVPPRIHLSACRPLPRRVFNCAHELGHHVFGHGSSIDELRDDAKQHPWEDPKEFMADAFAGFILLPTLGLRRAFATRGWEPATATAVQMFTIACHFEVGYETLVTHLSAAVNMVSASRAAALKRTTPKALRRDILGDSVSEPLIVVDRHRVGQTLDVEVNMLLCLPPGTVTTGDSLEYQRTLVNGSLFRAVSPGIARVSAASDSWATFVRVAPDAYVGLARYRHLSGIADE